MVRVKLRGARAPVQYYCTSETPKFPAVSDIRALCGISSSPLCGNTLSTGADVAGVHSSRLNSPRSLSNRFIWTMVGRSLIILKLNVGMDCVIYSPIIHMSGNVIAMKVL